jgi:Uma2 family endonuclease
MAIQDFIRRKLTYEDYVLFPADGMRHEILDGEHYVTAAPNPRHQMISLELGSRLHGFVKEHQLGWVIPAPCDVVLALHDIVQPDLLFISRERAGIVTENDIQGAPDLLVEILSGSTRRRDEGTKRERYESCGVREYWIVDPVRQTVLVYQLEGGRFRSAGHLAAASADVLTTPLLPGLAIPLREIFP